ncbi:MULTISPECIES: PTS system mannose/fructose/sorbose family transporter subunit IID [Aerococcus]|uniref:PTS system mannose/fructose/sorbose family transporter subunit IID n=1 Tax=Aerococcus mictus TaxID=2976810 RepID=A0A1E9P9Q9_9LACT|nr:MULTISPECIES: PTS system mannose/fructose/sorbose family transporter subunit IID [Aerococcus]KAA9234465.1 PTS system mannose/fructose/sorbose family transporter subunit IID [Aerococcus mictus]KAA9291512.1 PTS system mannose/fructose/sorbose family transporter subunit IID [Aerococcus mictus]MBU5610201.1 PTS system mannose/fructose/sorbose family transporter subunit IID [Aerococcus urinae]MCY3064145.1 PTS system mannose/fructose/sorbose family transporter subunit IID [Aerococcus mictus]MCY306
MENSKQVTSVDNKLLRQLYWRSFSLYAAVTPAKQGASGFSYAMQPFLENFYQDDEERRKAMVRHMAYFNTNLAMYPFILGVTASMEKENAEKADFNDESINAIKTSLMGPLAGIGDSLFWGVLRTIAAGIAVSLAMAGNIFAPIVFLLIFNIPVQLVRWYGGKLGYTLGSSLISKLYENGLISILTKAATTMGLMMVGAMTSQMVKLEITWDMTMNGETILKTQEMLDQIFVGILPLSITLICFYLLKVKNKSVNLIIFGIILLGIVLSVLGIA